MKPNISKISKIVHSSVFKLFCCLLSVCLISCSTKDSAKDYLAEKVLIENKYPKYNNLRLESLLKQLTKTLQTTALTLKDSECLNFDSKVNIIPLQSNELIAVTLPNNIYLSNSILQQCQNNQQLAFIIAHELAHLHLCHFNILRQDQKLNLEKEADHFAYQVLRANIFNPDAGIEILYRLKSQNFRHNLSTQSHLNERIKSLITH